MKRKRLTALLVAPALVLCLCLGLSFSAAAPARADGIDIKVKGQWDFSFGWVGNNSFKDSVNRSSPMGNSRADSNDSFQASQRIRTQINFITSEYLQGVLMFEIGGLDWGRGGTAGRGAGGRLDTDGVNIETKLAYLDWVIPYTEISVRMGLQTLTLPSTPMGSPVFDADVAGIVLSSPITDWLSATFFWIRPFDAYQNDNDTPDTRVATVGWPGSGMDDETDVFGLLLPMSFADWGLNVTPWFMYGFVGANSGFYDYLLGDGGENTVMARNSHAKAWWIGTHLEFSLFDPLVLNIEAIYGHLQPTALDGFAGITPNNGRGWGQTAQLSNEMGTSGWYLGATLDYKLDFMTPGIFGWYASGDDDDAFTTGKMGHLPVLGNDGGSFSPTSFGSAGYYGISQYDDGGAIMGTGTGTWGIGVQLADISFIEDLKHTLRFAYYQGTNDADVARAWNTIIDFSRGYYMYTADRMYLTDEDSVFEINFDHQYKVYENLTAVLELGWLHLDSDADTWGRRYKTTQTTIRTGKCEDSDNAWKAQLSFRYSF